MENPETNQNNEDQKGLSKAIPRVAMEISKVAANPKQGIAIIVAGVLVSIYLVYSIISDDADLKEKKPIDQVDKPKIVVKPPVSNDFSQNNVVPTLPVAPTLKDPVAPPPPPVNLDVPKIQEIAPPALANKSASLPNPGKLDNPTPIGEVKKSSDGSLPRAPSVPKVEAPKELPPVLPKETPAPAPAPLPINEKSNSVVSGVIPKIEDPDDKKARLARQKSSIMLIAGVPQKSVEEKEQDASFKKRTDMEYLLGKGKVIDAIIETAINTDLVSEVRAVISRDVFSESGKVVLIPKGSRIFGTYSSGVDGTYGRVNIAWDRIDLPSGYTVTMQATGVDSLGRKGTPGRLDNKIKEQITNTVLSTAVNVAFAGMLDKLVKPETTGSTSTQTQAVAGNLQQAVQAVYADSTITNPTQKINAMCSAATNAVTDPTNPAYKQVQDACSAARTNSSPADALAVLNSSLMAAANTSIVSAATASTPSKQQEATKKGMEDFTKTIENIVKQATPKPTVTIDQGAAVKIFVNRDYKFPRAAVNSSRVIQ